MTCIPARHPLCHIVANDEGKAQPPADQRTTRAAARREVKANYDVSCHTRQTISSLADERELDANPYLAVRRIRGTQIHMERAANTRYIYHQKRRSVHFAYSIMPYIFICI